MIARSSSIHPHHHCEGGSSVGWTTSRKSSTGRGRQPALCPPTFPVVSPPLWGLSHGYLPPLDTCPAPHLPPLSLTLCSDSGFTTCGDSRPGQAEEAAAAVQAPAPGWTRVTETPMSVQSLLCFSHPVVCSLPWHPSFAVFRPCTIPVPPSPSLMLPLGCALCRLSAGCLRSHYAAPPGWGWSWRSCCRTFLPCFFIFPWIRENMGS